MPANTSVAVFVVLLALMFFFWIGQTVNLREINSGDAAGKGLAQAFAVLLTLALWGVLAGLLVMAGTKGQMPSWAGALAYVLLPASCAAAVAAGNLLRNDGFRKPVPAMMIVPVATPLIIAAYAAWAFFPALRSAIPSAAAGSAWGLVLALTLMPWPSVASQARAGDAQRAQNGIRFEAEKKAELDAARQENLAKIQALGPEAPLWKWMEFIDEKKGVRTEALAAIHDLKRRQADAEYMLSQGVTGLLLSLPDLNLEATPALIKAHKDYLGEVTRSIRRPDAGSVQYSWISSDIDPYLASIQWMAEKHCGCAPEVAALEAEVRTYRNSAGKAEALAALEKARAADKN